MFRHADVVCLCLVCILWQFSMLRSAKVYVSLPSKYINLHILDPKKEQQYVLNKFINIYNYKLSNLLINLLTYPINIDRLYLQSNKSDSVKSTKLPKCLTLSDHCTVNPFIDTCS